MKRFPSAPPLAPALAVIAAACLLWLITDVSLRDVVAYLLYLVVMILLPGVALYLALSGQRELDLRAIALGAPLGYALELGAFTLGAASGQRVLGVIVPPLIGVTAAILIARRPRPRLLPPGPSSPYFRWILAALCIVAVGMLGERYFTATPLPGTVAQVGYYPDVIWQAAVAGEALHHWPLEIPSLAGEPLSYHYFSFLHMAATAYATGIDLSVVDLRLYVVPLVLLIVVQAVVAGRALDGRWTAGIIAAALIFLVGEASPWPDAPAEAFPLFYLSSSFVYGYVFFLPIVVLLLAMLSPGRTPSRGEWLLLAIFLLAAMGAKAAILPVLVGGLALAALYVWRLERPALRPVLGAGALAGVVLALSLLLIYKGEAQGASFEPFVGVELSQPFGARIDELPEAVPRTLYRAVAAVPLTIKLLLPVLFGLLAHYWLRRRRPTVPEALLLCIVLSSLALTYAITAPGTSQTYSLWYGYGAAALLAAAGWRALGARVFRTIRPSRPVIVALVVLGLIGWTTDSLFDDDEVKLWRYLEGEPVWTLGASVTPAVTDAMRWLRENSDADDVFAVSNQHDPTRLQARACFYTALAERRALLECEYGQGQRFPAADATDPAAHPFPERFSLNQRIFQGDAAAIAEARESYGVEYLVVDKRFPPVPDTARLEQNLGLVNLFENDEIAIFG